MLDDALAQNRGTAEAPASGWAWRREPPLGSAFLFARPLTSPAPRWAPGGAATPATRRPHALTDVQRLALEGLVLLGAELTDAFTADDLRREYRRLARRYHPDGRADAGPLERAQMARSFAAAADDYRCLREVVATRH